MCHYLWMGFVAVYDFAGRMMKKVTLRQWGTQNPEEGDTLLTKNPCSQGFFSRTALKLIDNNEVPTEEGV